MDNLSKLCLPVFHTSCDIFVQFFCMQLLFHMFSTLMSLRQIELKLKAKIEISLCMAIMQKHPLPSLYTQYYRTVLCIIRTILKEVKGLMNKLYAYALVRKKTGILAKFQGHWCYG